MEAEHVIMMVGGVVAFVTAFVSVSVRIDRLEDKLRETQHVAEDARGAAFDIRWVVDQINSRVNPKPKKEPDGGPYR